MQATPRQGDWLVLYGSLMRGLGAMDELGISGQLRFVGPCLCPGELYDLGPYPGLRPGPAHVVAELFALLDDSVISVLDEFEGFDPKAPQSSLYVRQRVELIEPAATEAWIYVYNHVPEAHERVPSGDWRAQLAERDGRRQA
jgi:gamma-glutamylcyclotransferase (GGCT)/AIG2-like uncharacterized protein YtfP